MNESWITVATFERHADALLAKSFLDAAEIGSWLRDEHVGRMMGTHSLAFGGIKLQVMPADLEVAQDILRSHGLSEPEQIAPIE